MVLLGRFGLLFERWKIFKLTIFFFPPKNAPVGNDLYPAGNRELLICFFNRIWCSGTMLCCVVGKDLLEGSR